MSNLFYEIIKINPDTEQIETLNPDEIAGSRLRRLLEKNNFLPKSDANPAHLIIFLANHPRFSELKFLHAVIRDYRASSTLNAHDETITHSTLNLLPILTICREIPSNRKFGVQFWDSSIWQRWVSTNGDGSDNTQLDEVLSEIRLSYELHVYDQYVAMEFCEFSTRVYGDSYLMSLDENGHANHVVPFPFFQETKFKQWFRKRYTDDLQYFNQLTWRLLLIDDKADEKLKIIKQITGTNYYVDLSEIDTTPTLQYGLNTKNKPILVFDYATNNEDALKKIQEKNYDIILLDYLLAGPPEKRELGIDFLKELSNNQNNTKYLKGPNDRFWIFSVTSFSWAFIDHMKEEGMSLSDNIWTFTRGADPINTPNAFLYYLTEFLHVQFSEFHFKRSIESIWREALLQLKRKETFKRAWAHNTLSKLINSANKIEALRNLAGRFDQKEFNPASSLFANSYLQTSFHKSEANKEIESGLYGYLTNFLFILSFSDGNKWEELKTNLEIIESKVPDLANSNCVGYSVLKNRINILKNQYN